MTGDVLKRECQYEAVMYQVKRMLDAGLITEKEFQEIEARFRAKYKPISGGYIVQTAVSRYETTKAEREKVAADIRQRGIGLWKLSSKARLKKTSFRQEPS